MYTGACVAVSRVFGTNIADGMKAISVMPPSAMGWHAVYGKCYYSRQGSKVILMWYFYVPNFIEQTTADITATTAEFRHDPTMPKYYKRTTIRQDKTQRSVLNQEVQENPLS